MAAAPKDAQDFGAAVAVLRGAPSPCRSVAAAATAPAAAEGEESPQVGKMATVLAREILRWEERNEQRQGLAREQERLLAERTAQLDERTEALTETNRLVQENERRVEAQNATLERCAAQLAELRQELQVHEEMAAARTGEAEAKQRELEAAVAELEAERSLRAADVEKLRADLEARDCVLDDLRARMAHQQRTAAERDAGLEGCAQQLRDSEALARELQAACDAKADELEAVMATVHQQKEENIRQAVCIEELQGRHRESTSRAEELEGKLLGRAIELEETGLQLQACKQRALDQAAEIESQAQQLEGAREQLQKRSRDLHFVRGELVESRRLAEERSSQLDAATQKLSDFATELKDMETWRSRAKKQERLLEAARAEAGGRKRESEGAASRVAELERALEAKAAEIAEVRASSKRQQRELAVSKKRHAEELEAKLAEERARGEARAAELREELGGDAAEAARLRSEVARRAREAQEAQAQAQEAQAQAQEAHAQAQEAQEAQEAAQALREQARVLHGDLDLAVEQLEAQRRSSEGLAALLEREQERILALSNDVAAAQDQAREALAENEALKAAVVDARARVDDERCRAEQHLNRALAIARECEASEFGAGAEELRAQNRELVLTVNQMKRECELSDAEVQSLRERLAVFETDLERVQEQHAELSGHVNHRQKIRHTMQLKEEVSALRAKLGAAQRRITKLEVDNFGCDFLGALASLGMTFGHAPEAAAERPRRRRAASAHRGLELETSADLPSARSQELERRCTMQQRALERLSVDFAHLLALIERAVFLPTAERQHGELLDLGRALPDLLRRLREVITERRPDAAGEAQQGDE